MSHSERIDLAIIGGGCAGLSVARELAALGSSLSVRILEPRSHYSDDRSWCFWAPTEHSLSRLVSHRWPKWSVSRRQGDRQEFAVAGIEYQYVRAIDFYTDALRHIEAQPYFSLQRNAQVTGLSADTKGWRIALEDSHLLAKYVIDTRPPSRQRHRQSALFQCFMGAELLWPSEQFSSHGLETGCAALMTDMHHAAEGFCFTYALPLDAHRALIEITFFSPTPVPEARLAAAFSQLLQTHGWQHANAVRTEMACLPMGLPTSPLKPSTTKVQAGVAGGALRPASGYGFQRIQRWAQACAQQLEHSGTLFAPAADHWRQRHMDALFLQVLRRWPEIGPVAFDRLFRQCPPDRLVRFMSDQASCLDQLAIIRAMPKRPFLQALMTPWAKQ